MYPHFLASICLSLSASSAFAAGAPEHSKVTVSQKAAPNGLALTFKVEPNLGMTVTLDAPWKLEVTGKDLALAKSTLAKGDMDTSLPGFVVTTTAKPAVATGTLGYTLTSFICTKEKTQCYREVHTGSFDWNLKTP